MSPCSPRAEVPLRGNVHCRTATPAYTYGLTHGADAGQTLYLGKTAGERGATHIFESPTAEKEDDILTTKFEPKIAGARRLRSSWRTAAILASLASLAAPFTAHAQGKLGPSAQATYDNRYEVYGGINFENFQAGQNLPKRMNFAGAEALGAIWLTGRLGVAADYRFEGGTTPVFANPIYNRVAVFQNNIMGGVQYRGPKGRYAAIDYHALAGVSQGKFDSATSQYHGVAPPLTPSQLGLYTNRTKPMFALGGSVDFNYSKNIAVRLQPDLILEHYGTELREFVAVSGGIVYRFGKH